MTQSELLLGLDVGSSSVKGSLLDVRSGAIVATATSPDFELPVHSPQPGFAEQDPETWWNHSIKVIRQLAATTGSLAAIKAIGISYQMHGLVLLDKNLHVLRPAIIWCDSRAIGYGEQAATTIGEQQCLHSLLNTPGNFTASKLAWIKENEPDTYQAIRYIALPGDFISYQLTGSLSTTPQGLSEAILWDYQQEALAVNVLDFFGFDSTLIPETLPSMSTHGTVSTDASHETGLPEGIPVTFKAGDQPVNAFALNVIHPGEVAANAGTSAVLFAVGDKKKADPQGRINSFLHVTHSPEAPRIGALMCVNGAGSMNSWGRKNLFNNRSYDELNKLAATIPPGASGLSTIPYGNGAERTLNNRNPGASFHGISLPVHSSAHFARAIQEGIAFALMYGLEAMQSAGITVKKIRAGQSNMFLSPVFCEAFCNTTAVPLELYNTDGSLGAARAAGLSAGLFSSTEECFATLTCVSSVTPTEKLQQQYSAIYTQWKQLLEQQLEGEHHE